MKFWVWITIVFVLNGHVFGESVDELLRREAELKRELSEVQRKISEARSSQSGQPASDNKEVLDLENFLRALERPAAQYLDLTTSAQRDVFAKETRAKIALAVDDRDVQIPLKVTNVRFDGTGEPVIDVDWVLDIPNDPRNTQKRNIWVIPLAYLTLNMSKEQAVTIEPGDLVQLNATLGYRSQETLVSKLTGSQSRLLAIHIRGAFQSEIFGNLTLKNYTVSLRKNRPTQSRLLTGKQSLTEQKSGVWKAPSKLKSGN